MRSDVLAYRCEGGVDAIKGRNDREAKLFKLGHRGREYDTDEIGGGSAEIESRKILKAILKVYLRRFRRVAKQDGYIKARQASEVRENEEESFIKCRAVVDI